MLCYGFLCVLFIIRYVCKLDNILGYNLKRRELKKNKDCVYVCKNCLCILYFYYI